MSILTTQYTVEDFVTDVKAILAEKGVTDAGLA